MIKRNLINIAAVIGGVFVAMTIFVYCLSFSRAVTCFWSVPGKRYDIKVERGCLLMHQLHDYRFNTPFRWGYYEPETPREFASFKTLSWWHGDNSWWERIGHTVNARQRCAGFEIASGEYWPPFIWQHRKVPFSAYQVPLWVFMALCGPLPLYRISRIVLSARRRSGGIVNRSHGQSKESSA